MLGKNETFIKIYTILFVISCLLGCGTRNDDRPFLNAPPSVIGKDQISVVATKKTDKEWQIKIYTETDNAYKYYIQRPWLIGNIIIDNVTVGRFTPMALEANSIVGIVVDKNNPLSEDVEITLRDYAPIGKVHFRIGFRPYVQVQYINGTTSYTHSSEVYWSNEIEIAHNQ